MKAFGAIFILIASLTTVSALRADTSCLQCHDAVMSKKFPHPGALMDCTACHAQHDVDTGRPYRLKAGINQLCSQCHNLNTLVGDGDPTPGHPTHFVGHPITGHPVDKVTDPVRGNELSCTSCHSPHSADHENLFPYAYDDSQPNSSFTGPLCMTCHSDLFPKP